MTKRRLLTLLCIGILLLAGGALVLLLPHIWQMMYHQQVQEQKAAFFQPQTAATAPSQPREESVPEETQPPETLPYEELYQLLQEENRRLYEENQKDLADPFSYSALGVDLTKYGLPDNVIGFLSVPKLEIELPILLGATQENMAQGAGHLTETSYPIGGSSTNCVLAAHRGYQKADMFRNIQWLELGDKIYIQNFRETLTYEVVQIRIIAPTAIEECLIQPDRDLVTLLTCHPYGQNSQRYLVICERSED